MRKAKESEAWLLGMKKFSRVHDYSKHMKVSVVIFSLRGKVDIWWEELKYVKKIQAEELYWRIFKRYFIGKYLSNVGFNPVQKLPAYKF